MGWEGKGEISFERYGTALALIWRSDESRSKPGTEESPIKLSNEATWQIRSEEVVTEVPRHGAMRALGKYEWLYEDKS